jgi:hypothetical protein
MGLLLKKVYIIICIYYKGFKTGNAPKGDSYENKES